MKNWLILCGMIVAINLQAQTNIINISGRNTITLDGKWNYIIDPYETGYYDYRSVPFDLNPKPYGGFFLDRHQTEKSELLEYDFDKSPCLTVPGDWNSQDNKLLYYEGTIWYRRLFDYTPHDTSSRLFIYFGAANYESDVYLNGKKLGKHIGGFTPFDYEIKGILKEKGNSLVVKVDDKRKKEGVPTVNTDWWNYGGITRDVMIVEVPNTFISDYSIQLRKGSLTTLAGYVLLNGSKVHQSVKVEIPELHAVTNCTANDKGVATFEIQLHNPTLWCPENPKRYEVDIHCETDKIAELIGFRSIATRNTDILLNGQPIFLRGISIHGENPIHGGRVYSMEDARMLLTWAKELNCNYVRLAHYPHCESMLRMADEMGLLVWEENPVYWTIQWENEETFENAKNQLTDLIFRDKNYASVIIWSMANETPVGEARNLFLKKLATQARILDSTRLISAAMEMHSQKDDPNIRVIEDPFAAYLDIVSFNQYIGWYDGLPERCDQINWIINYNKPVIISEFGAGALQGYHGDRLTHWTEEYQEDLYKRTLIMLSKIPQFRGLTPWILCDFRSPKRMLPNIQDGWNRKGLIGENGVRKKAFYVLQNYYHTLQSK